MPSRGLPSVEQRFTADGSEYAEAILELIEVNRQLVISIRETVSETASVKSQMRELGATVGELSAAVSGLKSSVSELKEQLTFTEAVAELEEVRDSIREVGGAARDSAAMMDIAGNSTSKYITQHVQLTEVIAESVQAHGDLGSSLGDINEQFRQMTAGLGDVREAAAALDYSPVLARSELAVASLTDTQHGLTAEIGGTGDAIAAMELQFSGSADRISASLDQVAVKAQATRELVGAAVGSAINNMMSSPGVPGRPEGYSLRGQPDLSHNVWEANIAQQVTDFLKDVTPAAGGGGSGGSGYWRDFFGGGGGGGSGGGGGPSPGNDDEAAKLAREIAAASAEMDEMFSPGGAVDKAAMAMDVLTRKMAAANKSAFAAMSDAAVAAAALEAGSAGGGWDPAAATAMGRAMAAVMGKSASGGYATPAAAFAAGAAAAGAAGTTPSSSGGSAAYGAAATAAALRSATGPGGGGGGSAALGAAMGAAFGGGGGGGAAGSLLTGFDYGTAARQSAAMLGFIATWYPRFHYVMMATNEVLATLGPATIAAGNAVAVGAQGGQTMWGRLQAINDVSQSLGAGALGETSGQFLGLGSSLQSAQNTMDPEVWELLGAGINSVKGATDNATSGFGNFWSMGQNVLDMLDRFSANITLGFKGNAGKELSGVISGGVGDLQQFGDVFGNLGKLFMNVVPNLPGVGGDLLTTLDGFTKGLADISGWMGDIGALGPTLAFEAGSRYGPALVGTAGRGLANLGSFLGSGVSGLGSALGALSIPGSGVLANVAGDVTAGTGIRGIIGQVAHGASADEAAALGISEGDLVAGTGVAGFLGSLSAPEIGAAAAGAFVLGRQIMEPTPAQAAMGSLQSQVNQAQFLQGGSDLVNAMNVAAAAASTAQGAKWSWDLSPLDMVKELVAGGPRGTDLGSLMNFATQYSNFLGAGAQVQQQLGSQLGGMSLSTAYGLLDQSGVQMSTAFNANGTLTNTALQQVLNSVTGYQAMHVNQGQFGVDVAAVSAEQGLSATHLSDVNSAFDSFVQNATEGTTALTGFNQSLQAAQTLGASLSVPKVPAETATQRADAAHAAAEARVSARKDQQNFAQALTSFTSTQGISAWNALSSTSTTSPGLIQQAETTMDWLRTAGSSYGWGGAPAVTSTQIEGAGAYLAKQLLPYGKDSSVALAQISTIAQQAGLGSSAVYNPNLTQAQNYKDISGAIDKVASSQKAFNQTMTDGAEATSNLTAQAQGFSSAVGNTLTTALSNADPAVTKSAAAYGKFADSLERGKSSFSTSDLASFAQNMQDTGQNLASVQAIIDQTMKRYGSSGSGITAAESDISKIISGESLAQLQAPGAEYKPSPTVLQQAAQQERLNRQLSGMTPAEQKEYSSAASLSIKADTSGASQVKAALAGIHNVTATVSVKGDPSGADQVRSAMEAVHDRTVAMLVQANTAGAQQAQAAISAVQSKTVTVDVHYITTGSPSAMTPVTASRYGPVAAQHGFRVPGYGGGDVFPAMLEPGELVVPKHLVGAVAPVLGGKIPGFAEGGIAAPGVSAMYSAMTGAQSAGLIAAALGSSTMGNAASTLTSGMAYISGRYGSPANAQAHEVQYGWFDQGGLLMPGYTLAYNGTGVPERVMSIGGGPGSGPAAGGSPVPPPPLSAALVKLEQELEAQLEASGFGKKVAVSIVQGLTSGLADSEGTKGIAKIATSLVDKLQTEVKYANSVASTTVSGLDFAGLNPSNGSISSQMQSYLTSIGQFSSAIQQLSAGGLNKTLLSQLVQAGPSALPEAQAILGGPSAAATSTAMSGLNFASIDPTQGPVAQQMQTYTSSLQQFNKDLGTASKQGLNKNLLGQLVAAGPSSDSLLQSILGAGTTGGSQVAAVNQAYAALSKAASQFGVTAGQAEGGGKGEISAINKLYGAINHAATVFGQKAAGAVYGGSLSAKDATITASNVTVNVSLGAGAGSSLAGLTSAQLKQIVSEIEAKLLQQAKRNRKTGTTLKGYGS
jgi:hypothetical protein